MSTNRKYNSIGSEIQNTEINIPQSMAEEEGYIPVIRKLVEEDMAKQMGKPIHNR